MAIYPVEVVSGRDSWRAPEIVTGVFASENDKKEEMHLGRTV